MRTTRIKNVLTMIVACGILILFVFATRQHFNSTFLKPHEDLIVFYDTKDSEKKPDLEMTYEQRTTSKMTNKFPALKVIIVKKKFGEADQGTIETPDQKKATNKPAASSSSGSSSCRLPDLKIDDPSVKSFFKPSKKLECSKVEKNWVYVKNSTFYIDPDAIERHHDAEITCDYTHFWRVTDDKTKSETFSNFKTGTRLKGDFFKVSCKNSEDDAKYSNVHAAIVASEEATKRAREKQLPKKALGLNVYVAGFDSLSRLTFMRKLPKLYKYLTERMDTIVLEGYNIVGDGTPQALIPIFTGKTEVELPLTRKRYPSAKYVNVYPFVWNEYRDAGYVTLYGEDAARVGTFTYRLKGFKEQPTDHYMRTFYTLAEPEMKNHKTMCWGSEEHQKTHFDYVEHFWTAYPDPIRKFAFQFHSYLSHDDINFVEVADDYMVEHMKFFVDNGHMNNSIIVFMSDHGHRFAELRATQQGKLEERLPFFSFAFPPWFKQKYPRIYETFKTNARRLTTPFDIHATLQNLLNFDPDVQPRMGDLKSRELSLFDEIPAGRSCTDAGIETHWCTCLDWTEVSTQEPLVEFIAHSLVEAINKETEGERKLCSEIRLDRIEKAAKYAPASAVLSYKQAKDKDGFVPDLTGNATAQIEYYQLDVWTQPGNAHYEMSASVDSTTKQLTIDLDAVQHVNMFGDQPHCIIDKDYFLAKWCKCYDKI